MSAPRLPASGHRALVALIAAYVVLLLALGPVLHPIGIRGALDHYAERGRQIADGVWIGDPFHPFLVPELAAVVTLAVGDAFAATRAVSNVAAGLLLYSSGRLAAAVAGQRALPWVVALLAANGAVLVLGVEAGADMTAAALAVTALWLLAEPPPTSRALASGACLGLAIAARYSSAALLPALAALILAVRGAAWRQRAVRLATFAGGCVLGYLPNLIPTVLVQGTPLPGNSWQNLAWKLSPTGDTRAVWNPPYASFAELLRTDGERLVQRTLADIGELWTAGLGRALAGGHAPAWIVATFALALPAALVVLLWRAPRPATAALGVLAVWTTAVAATFFPQTRLLLPVLPVAATAVVAAVLTVAGSRPWLGALACAAATVLTATSVVPAARAFAREHPVAEVQAARAIARAEGPLVAIGSCYALLHSYVDARVSWIEPPPLADITPASVAACVRAAVRERALDFVVLGPHSAHLRRVDAVAAELPELRVESSSADVLVLRVERAPVEWLAAASAVRTGADAVALQLTVAADGVLAAGFRVHAPGAEPWLLPLARTGDRTFAGTLPLRGASAAGVSFEPQCLTTNGAWLRAAPIPMAPR
jgi:hypothetical protein